MLPCKCTRLQLHKRTQISQGHQGQSGWAVPSRGVRDVWETQWWLAKTTEAWAIVWYSGLYLFSGLLNEVTQVVSLNTFPISIMNHLLLIIPVQPKGGMLLFRAIGSVYVRACLHCSVWVHANFCARYLPKAQNEGMDTAYVTGCRLFNEKMDERWHTLGTYFFF